VNTIREFSDSAKALSKNPLGIIALFIILIYGLASLVLGTSQNLGPEEKYPIVLFLVIFPFVVLAVFAWLVSQHHQKLYAPKDYINDDSFLKALERKKDARPGLREIEQKIEQKVSSVLNSEDMLKSYNSKADLKESLKQAAETITTQIKSSSFITVDARSFTGSPGDVFELPAAAFSTFSELTNEIYFSIERYVKAFEYGYTWVIKDAKNDKIIKNARMITGFKPGVPLRDDRSLDEVGIYPGMTLKIVSPHDLTI
jgi:hypothetical protein